MIFMFVGVNCFQCRLFYCFGDYTNEQKEVRKTTRKIQRFRR